MIETLEPALTSGSSIGQLGSLMGKIWSVNFTAESRTKKSEKLYKYISGVESVQS
jgi:hypothetical protein